MNKLLFSFSLAAAPFFGLVAGCSGGGGSDTSTPTATPAPASTATPRPTATAGPTTVPTPRPTAVPSPTPSNLNAFNLQISGASGSNVTEGTLSRVDFYLNDDRTTRREGYYQGSLQQGGIAFNQGGGTGRVAQRVSILLQRPFMISTGPYSVGPTLPFTQRVLVQLAQYDGQTKIWEAYEGRASVTASSEESISVSLDGVKLRHPATDRSASTGVFTLSGTATLAIGSRKLG